ncbi:MAG: cyclic pyranopterin monophosphate synthase MoaC [Defluviitaleaceae bacterium]|nr:cyclic pyranopterin monophosphate synthase MoaC [Defluviitaleaceae bacterium]
MFNHFDEKGNAIMVDVSKKNETDRVAVATGVIKMSNECYNFVKIGGIKKGDVLGIARIAGIMSTKQTHNLIPLCHNIPIEKVSIEFEYIDETNSIKSICTVKTKGKTGVEMEALTGVNISLLTIYDMCKAYDKSMTITNIFLNEKKGGKSNYNR